MKSVIKKLLGNKIMVFYRAIRYLRENPHCLEYFKPNEKFKNQYDGERCFIFGNGPSLNGVDFSLLGDEYTFTVNQLSRREDFHKLHTNFHMWVDTRFFDLDPDDKGDMELLQSMKDVNTSDNKPVVFYKWEAFNAIKKFRLDEMLDIYYFSDVFYENKNKIVDQKIDYTKLVPWLESVTQYAVLLAVYMGFKEIYLLGCDCTGFMNLAMPKLQKAEKSEYGYQITENEKKRLERAFKIRDIRDELLCYVGIYDTYGILEQYCSRQGVKLYNATEGGLLDCVPRVKLEDVLAQKKQ